MTDPAVQAIAEALTSPQEYGTCWVDPHPSQRPRAEAMAQVAVDAHRRQVLASHPDAERWTEDWLTWHDGIPLDPHRTYALLAALADETAARQAAEADRDRLAALVEQIAPTDRDGQPYVEGAGQPA